MKRIVILCDGTWNSSDMEHRTNVLRLADGIMRSVREPLLRAEGGRMVPVVDADGAPVTRDVAQVPIYVPGVGTGRRGLTAVGRLSDRALGGALGWGLMDNVAHAYEQLAFQWRPGDEVQLFGFSRGAFTARSLAGMIRNVGLLAPSDLRRLPEAVAHYTNPIAVGPERRQARTLWWRARHSSHTLVDPDDLGRLEDTADDWEANEALARLRRAPRFTIRYMGIWDTVGAMGVPGHLTGATVLNRRHQFHDTRLSRMVDGARHAVAVDERRRTFPPTLWTNLSELNGARIDTPYRQQWFPGDHGSVGGGGPERGLSSAALAWVAEGAEAAGLAFYPGAVEAWAEEADHLAPLRSKPRGTGLAARGYGAWQDATAVDRDGPDRRDDIHDSAVARWRVGTKGAGGEPFYAPPPLGRHREWLDGLKDGADGPPT